MNEKNIVLVGFMAVGKSVAAKKLGEISPRQVVSTDRMIEAKEQSSIARIFDTKGEAYFRKVEAEIVSDVSRQKGVIIDCGGGIVLNPQNMIKLKETGCVFYLAASTDTIIKRIKGQKNRPLLNVSNQRQTIEALLAQRQPLYDQADYTITTDDKTVEQICKNILEIMNDE